MVGVLVGLLVNVFVFRQRATQDFHYLDIKHFGASLGT